MIRSEGDWEAYRLESELQAVREALFVLVAEAKNYVGIGWDMNGNESAPLRYAIGEAEIVLGRKK